MALLPGQRSNLARGARTAGRMQASLQHARVGPGRKPVSYQDWASGGFLRALTGAKPPAAPRPAGAPATPAVGAPPLYRPAPPDPQLESDINNLAAQRDISLMGLRNARTQGLGAYGFTENEATGALAVDPNNPWGKAAQLKRNYDAERAGRGGSMAARGNLYAGSYQKAQDVVNMNQLGAEDELQKALTAFLGENLASQRQVAQDYQTDLGRAQGESTARIKDNPLYEPTIGGESVPGQPKPKPSPSQQTKNGKYKWPDGKGYVHSRPYQGR